MTNYHDLAMDIYNWCDEHGCWTDCAIFFNGKAIASWYALHDNRGKEIAFDLYEYENKNPLDYFEYANPNTLFMSFGCELCSIINAEAEGWTWLTESFDKIFDKYGCYYEMGDYWNLSVYEF